MFEYMVSKHTFLSINNPKEARKYLDVVNYYFKQNQNQRSDYVFYYYLAKFNTFYEEKNIKALEKLMPELQRQAKIAKSSYELIILEEYNAKYYFLKEKKIHNKKELLYSIEVYKKNNKNYSAVNVLNILKI
jgi:DNA-binding SARP family transcriptional activator